LVNITITRDGTPVDDSASPSVVIKTDFGQFAPYEASNPVDDPGQQNTTESFSSGSASVKLYAIKAGTANLSFNYTDKNGGTTTKKATVTFGPNGLTLTLDPVTAAVKADGQTPAQLHVSIKRGSIAFGEGGSVLFSTDQGYQFEPFSGPTPDPGGNKTNTQTDQNGDAYAQLYSLSAGTAHVTVTFTSAEGATASASGTVTFSGGTTPQVGNIAFVSAVPSAINLQGSGGAQTSTVTFTVNDPNGQPVVDGVLVNFTLNNPPTGANLSANTDVTKNGTGEVSTVLNAGSARGSVTVTASADSTTGTKTADSQPITIGGAGVNYKNFTLACDHYNISGFQYFGLENNCTVFAADRNNGFVPNTQVTLLSEAGGVPTTVPVSDTTGQGAFVYQTQCPYPRDVSPYMDGGEFYQLDAGFYDQCHKNAQGVVSPAIVQRTVNQRDGRAALVAYVLGEECFNDLNGNGQYDGPSEFNPDCDLGDPFLDENDNGVWDGPGVDPMIPEGEPYVPSPGGDGGYHGPNGQWDSSRLIWRQVFIVWTDTYSRQNLYDISSGSPHLVTNTDYGSLDCSNTYSFYFELADTNGNLPAAVAPGDYVGVICNGDCVNTPAGSLQDVAKDLNESVTLGTPIPANVPFIFAPNRLPALPYSLNSARYPSCSGTPGTFSANLTSQRTLGDDATGSAQGTESIVNDGWPSGIW
jgi:hypothetical protein